MNTFRTIKESLLHLLFPHICTGCGSDLLATESSLCLRCMASLPATNFELHEDNPVYRIFRGRMPVCSGSAQFYFTKESLMQQLMHQFKYKGNKDLGYQLGRIMGEQLARSRNYHADLLIPLPLFPAKEKRRGYNQARILCEGMSATMNIPVLDKVITRPHHTETQTRKGRIERWKNIEGKFVLKNPGAIDNKHILLVDDVVTTGATLESCGMELLKGTNITLSIATLCMAFK